MSDVCTRGVIFIHSAPASLCPHVEWAIGSVVGKLVSLEWTVQGAAAGMYRAELSWVGRVGFGEVLVSALRGWEHLRFDVVEEAAFGGDGGRWSYTPGLGVFYAQTDSFGNVVVPEDRVRAAMELLPDVERFREAMDLVLGCAWDDELEPFRCAGADAPVRWLHMVG